MPDLRENAGKRTNFVKFMIIVINFWNLHGNRYCTITTAEYVGYSLATGSNESREEKSKPWPTLAAQGAKISS